MTEPPGGYPTTVGGNPNPPADRQVSDDEAGGPVQAPGPYSTASAFRPQGANY